MAFYVSPNGNDNNRGTTDFPFLTLARAVEETRLNNNGKKEILLFGGEYENTSVILDNRDCGLSMSPVDESNKVILRGGVKVSGWNKIYGDLYILDVPAEITGDILMLEVNGRFCSRSKFPQKGYIEHVTECSLVWLMSSEYLGWDATPTEAQFTEMTYDSSILPDNFNWDNADITVFHRWDESLVSVRSHDRGKNLLTLTPCGYPVGAFGVKRYIVWNTEYGMEPGNFRIDKSERKIYYRALPGENMQTADTYIPIHNHIIKINEEITGLAIKDITLMGVAAPMKPSSFAASALTGAIDGSVGLNDCSLTGLTFKNVCGWGIRLGVAGRELNKTNISILNCRVEDAGAGGISVSGGKNNCIVSKNKVERIGLIYFSGVGIHSGGFDVIENVINNMPYSGIIYYGDNGRVMRNRVTNVMKVLNDGGGIYVTNCKGGVMSGNIIENIPKCEEYYSQRHALYLDMDAIDWVVEDNITINCADVMMNHIASKNIIRNNNFIVYGSDEDLLISFARCDNYVVEGNTFRSDGTITFAGRKGAISVFKNNILYSVKDSIRNLFITDDYVRSEPVEVVDRNNALN